MKIKMFTISSNFDYSPYEEDQEKVLISGVTGWQEVTEQERWDLLDWITRKSGGSPYGKKEKIVMVTQREELDDIPACIADYKKLLKKDEEKEKKRKEINRKAAATREKKKLEKELEEYEKLKAKFEN